MSRMTIRTYRITSAGRRIDLTAPEEVETEHRPAAPLAWSSCGCPRCLQARPLPDEEPRHR
ncbi:hypothetical protein ACIGXM_23725 [Kitasatospora sp. NPDC052896]|uniref:hypothetical protein n=1 Tax=Kitasatospora sp. NPDC052896 TaxID=3364061 RepID=UPI0037C99A93